MMTGTFDSPPLSVTDTRGRAVTVASPSPRVQPYSRVSVDESPIIVKQYVRFDSIRDTRTTSVRRILNVYNPIRV